MEKAHKFQIVKKSDKMKQNISQKIDSGRSMVEMLGVLAVIGVLSVVSILGYRFAMAKWRANETVNELNIRAYDIATRFDKLVAANTREIEMEMGDTTKLGYPITARISPQYEDYFEMFVSNVPTDVCKELLNSQWQAPYSIFVGVEEYEASSDICEQAENVELAYEFYKDLSTRDEIPEETRHKIQRCNHKNNCQCGTCNEEIGLCESECEKDQLCLKRYDDPQWMKCCDKENKVGDYCCAYVEDGKCCNYNGKCCPPDKPLIGKDGTCYSCTYTKGISLDDISTCSKLCPQRYISDDLYKRCVLCGASDTSVQNYPVVAAKDGGICRACSYTGSIDMGSGSDTVWKNRCNDKCPGERYNYNYLCYHTCTDPTKPLLGTDGGCYPCDDMTHSIRTDMQKGVCGVNYCAGKRKIQGDFCIAECPDNTIRGKDGACYSCTYTKGISLDDTSTCSKFCPQRYISDDLYKLCVLCGAEDTSVQNYPVVAAKEGGICRACSHTESIDMGSGSNTLWKNRCDDKCPGERYHYNYLCYHTCTDPTKPLLGTDGSCYPCDDMTHSIRTDMQKGVCGVDYCAGKRKIQGDFCIAECPNNTIRGKDGICYSCTYEKGISLDDINTCSTTCPQRYISDNLYKLCVLCGAQDTTVQNYPVVEAKDNGICRACSYSGSIDMGSGSDTDWKNWCDDKCPGERYHYNYLCYHTCTDAKPLSASDGSCQDCNYKNATLTTNCDKCSTNRIIENGSCIREKCSDGYFEGSNGECYACNITTDIPVKDEAACNACLNRTYQDDMCMENK